MTTIEPTKADLLRAIEIEQDWWRVVIDSAQERSPLSGDEEIDGTWTFKELLAHIDGWRSMTVARFEAAAAGGDPVEPWPEEMSEATEEGTDEINGWFVRRAHALTLDEVIAMSTARLETLRALVQAMSADELLTPGRFARFGPEFETLPFGPAVIGYSISHVHDIHAPALQMWLSERLGQHLELPPAPSNFGYED